MAQCIAVTQKGQQCKRYGCAGNVTICKLHITKKPTYMLFNGANVLYTVWFANHANREEKLAIGVDEDDIDDDDQANIRQNVANNAGAGAIAGAANAANAGNAVKIVKRQHNAVKAKISVKEKMVAEKTEEEQIEELEKFAQINTCNCCMDDSFTHSELIQCSNACVKFPHLVCDGCFSRHLNVQLSEGIVSVKCMFDSSDKCGGEYQQSQIMSHISPENGVKFMECMDLETTKQLAAVCDNYQICPLCNKFGCIVENLEQHGGWIYLPCGRCGESWCSRCMQRAHGNEHCYKFNFTGNTTEEEKEKAIDVMIHTIVTEKLMHKCVKCMTKFVKEEGCNLMTCPSCHTMMCYICSQVLQVDARGNKYWHFSGHVGSGVGAVCPLWNNAAGDGKENQGNTEYNIRQIFKEFNIIMEQNRDKKLRDLVYKRIVENFKGEKAAELYNLYSTALGVKYYLLDVWKLENTMKWKIMSVKF